MARLSPLPSRLRNLLANPPTEGGRHDWLFRLACACRGVLTESQLRTLMHGLKTANWGRELRDTTDIERAIDNGFLSEPRQNGIRWPSPNPTLIRSALEVPPLFDTAHVVAIEPDEVIDRLFPEGGLLCCAASAGSAKTADRRQWCSKLAAQSFIVPGPMSKLQGYNQDGVLSKRCRDNAPNPRRYLVAECDDESLTKSQKISLLTALVKYSREREGVPCLPLVLAVDSGGVSVHGWFRCEGIHEEQLLRWALLAVELGHDKAMWKPEQFFRMPGGTRYTTDPTGGVTHIKQGIFYFNL